MVKIRHLGRALLGLAALFAVSVTSTPTATAQVTATTVVSSLDELATASTNGRWCVLYNTGRHWYIQDNLSSSLATYSGTITSTSTDASAANGLKCMVKFVSTGTDNMYKIQTVSGKYFSTLTSDQAVSLVTSSDDAGTFTISTCATTGNYQLKESANSVNLEGGPSAVLGWGTSDLSSQSTNNGLYTISTVTLGDGTDGSLATVTYNYSVDGTSFGSTTSTQFVGLTVDAPSAVDFLSVTSYDATTVAAEGTTVDVACTENLPFTVTTDDSNPYYYALDIHSDDTWGITRFTNSFFVQGEESSVVASTSDIIAYSSNIVPAEKYQWVIKGDLINGFTLYNRSAAKYLTVETGNTENQATLSETATTFKIAKSTITDTRIPNISDAFCLYAVGNDLSSGTIYLNHRDGNSGGVIKGWTSRDGGSTIIARPIGFFAQKYYNSNFAAYQDAPAGAIGTLKDADFTAAKAAIATLSSNACDATAAAALVEANTTLGTCETIEVPSSFDGQYYRLYNKKKEQYATFSTTSSGTFYITSSTNGKSAGSVIAFTANSDDASTYTISAEGLALGQATTWNANVVPGASTAGIFTITNSGSGLFVIYNSNGTFGSGYESYQYLHLANTSGDGNVVGWEASEDASQWYFVPAEDVEISLTTIGDASYATTCLPFAVSSVSGATANIGTLDTENKEITPSEISTIPANTGVILIGEANVEKATLTIGAASAFEGANDLLGTCVPLTNNSYLTLGRLTGTEETATAPGFYTFTGTTIHANRAYLSGDNLQTVRLALGDATTDIDAATLINAEQTNAPVYDLSGRRVLTPAKGGIYLQGGKKYIAR